MEVLSIVFLSFIILIIILSIVFKKQLTLRIISIRYGKYSYPFVKKFKKFANKSPFPYCFKDDIMPYLRLVKSKKEKSAQYYSEKNVLFENLDYNLTIDELLKNQGEPTCFNIFQIKGSEIKAFGYTIEKFNVRVKAVFFFINGIYFMADYLADNIKELDLKKVAEFLFNQTDIKEYQFASSFVIDCNNHTSILFYENGFTLLVRYLNTNNKQFQEIIN